MLLTNHDGPDIDKDKESQVGELLQREDEGEDVVWDALRVAVQGVESVRRERRRHNPLVVRLVEPAVKDGMVQAAVNQVDEAVGKGDKGGELQEEPPARISVNVVIEHAVSPDLHEEWRCRAERHDRYRLHCLDDLELYLVLQKLGMVERALVENEDVG